jgi:hypothetical protein
MGARRSSEYVVTDAAWYRNAQVMEIELSTDDGQNWTAAAFVDRGHSSLM